MLESLTPNLMIDDVNRSVNFYTKILEFQFILGVPEGTKDIQTSYDASKPPVHALVRKDNVELMLHKNTKFTEEFPEFKGSSPSASLSMYVMVDDIDTYYETIKENVKLFSDLTTQWYGNKEFYIKDPDGYILGFAQRVASRKDYR